MGQRSTLERQMLTYFGLIAAASLFITIEFIWALQTVMTEAQAFTGPTPTSDSEASFVIRALGALRNKAMLMCVVQTVITLIVMIMFIRRITAPLQQMVEDSIVISEGDLSRTIRVRRQDEIGRLGETINGLTSNIQEIVAFGQDVEASVESPLNELRGHCGDDPECVARLDEIEGALAGFRDILDHFKLFPAPLSGTEGEEKSGK
jgi:methyl-accepting chemotaxis protein